MVQTQSHVPVITEDFCPRVAKNQWMQLNYWKGEGCCQHVTRWKIELDGRSMLIDQLNVIFHVLIY